MPPCSARPMIHAILDEPTSSAATKPLRACTGRTPLALLFVFVRNVSPIWADYPLRTPFPRHRPRITIVQSKHITIGIAKIDHLDIALEDAFLDDQPFEVRELPLPSLFRQPNRHTAREQAIQAPLSNALDRLQPCGNRLP